MPRMSIVDAAFFLLETPERPMHVAPLIVLDPPQGYRGNFADDLFKRLFDRPIGPPFNYVARMPKSGLLGRWEEVPVKPEDHISRVIVPKGVTIEEFACELYEDLLDMSRPLWHAYIISKEGDDRAYLFCKLHHALSDGIGMVNMFGRAFRLDPADTDLIAPWEGMPKLEHDEQPGLFLETGFDWIGKTTSQATAVMSGAMKASTIFIEQYLGTMGLLKLERGLANPFHPPYGYFDVVPEKKRIFSHCSISLARMKAAARCCGVSVNDVFMTVVDAAVSRLLTEGKVKIERPLIAEMMMATKSEGGSKNNCAPVNIPLGQPNTTPLERIKEISLHTAALKSTMKGLSTGAALMYSMPLHLAPVIVEKFRIQNSPVMTDIFVSNPYGIPVPSYMMGARVESTLPFSAIPTGHVMNITAVSHVDEFQIGVVAFKSAFPHLDHLTTYMVEAFENLVMSTGMETAPRQSAVPSAKPAATPTRAGAARRPRRNAAPTHITGVAPGDGAQVPHPVDAGASGTTTKRASKAGLGLKPASRKTSSKTAKTKKAPAVL